MATRWCRPPILRSSTHGSGSASATSTSTRFGRGRRRSLSSRSPGSVCDARDATTSTRWPASTSRSPRAPDPVSGLLAPALPDLDETRAEYEADFDDPRFTTFVVDRDGEVIGSAIACPIEVSSTHKSLALPPDAGFLGFAAVFPERRGGGAGRLLGEAVLDWARETGREWVVTDSRMTNLLASRAWLQLGFRPTFYRLFRAIA